MSPAPALANLSPSICALGNVRRSFVPALGLSDVFISPRAWPFKVVESFFLRPQAQNLTKAIEIIWSELSINPITLRLALRCGPSIMAPCRRLFHREVMSGRDKHVQRETRRGTRRTLLMSYSSGSGRQQGGII
ncbi:hypothetical protein BaRGS_00025860 [Batillaria attramentaria]|uniref:Uncharacterized protein n=1 Tax=Batillaria attramentaria TaxID=370345 RepID=A0ABD0K6D3_9CAEN